MNIRTYTYTYIYREREGERERELQLLGEAQNDSMQWGQVDTSPHSHTQRIRNNKRFEL
jgi:hypothetical protein